MSNVIHYIDNKSKMELSTAFHFESMSSTNIELFFVMDGAAKIIIDDQSYHMQTDDVIVVNKTQYFDIKAVGEHNLLFRFSISDYLLAQAFDNGIIFNCNSLLYENKNYGRLREKLIRLIDFFAFEEKETNFLQMSILYELLSELCAFFTIKSEKMFDKNIRIAKIIKEINERYFEDITLQEMAELIHMDQSYFSKYFKQKMKINFKDYLFKIRFQYAVRELIQTDKNITHVAVDNGFFSVNNFNKKFKELKKMTPSDYRKTYQIKKSEQASIDAVSLNKSYENYKKNKVQHPATSKQQVSLSVKQCTSRMIKPTWSNILNLGEAEFILKDRIRKQIEVLTQRISYTHGRISNLFAMKNITNEARYVDEVAEIIDALLKNQLTPWITIRFNKDNIDGQTGLPFSEEDWTQKLKRFFGHCVNHYGRLEVGKWTIEIVLENVKDTKDYEGFSHFYRLSYEAIKQSHSQIKIGGCSFSIQQEVTIESLLEQYFSDVHFDYLSFSLFPYKTNQTREKRNFERLTDPDFLSMKLKQIQTLSHHYPIYITEWSNTVSRSNKLNDSLFKGTFIIKNSIDIFDFVDGMGYWLGLDLLEEKETEPSLLSGGNGLLNKNGLFKPAMHAFLFLQELNGLEYVYKNDSYLICTRDQEEYFILGHEYTHPNSLYFLKDESQLELTEIDNFFEEQIKEHQFTLYDLENGLYEIRYFSCEATSGNLMNDWKKFNYHPNLRAKDLMYLEQINTPLQQIELITVDQNKLRLHKKISTNGFFMININKRQ